MGGPAHDQLNSSALAMELHQSCTKPSIYPAPMKLFVILIITYTLNMYIINWVNVCVGNAWHTSLIKSSAVLNIYVYYIYYIMFTIPEVLM